MAEFSVLDLDTAPNAGSREAARADAAASLEAKIDSRTALAAVIGLGYVGLPLLMATARAGFPVLGYDIDAAKIERLGCGQSYIDGVSGDAVAELLDAERLALTDDAGALARADVIVICVPTPLAAHREPDTSFIEATGALLARQLRRGQLVVLESTSYPGTTTNLLQPLLESSGLQGGEDFFLAYSPEREDPGNARYGTTDIPKLVAGAGPDAARLAEAFYAPVVDRVVAVSSPDVAEAAKLTENIFRSVNIALVNELKLIYDRMGIDVWEVIEAASTKPFGFMPFYPGPGLGGHCIPIDPFYLAWSARSHGMPTRFIELAGEINHAMPGHVVAALEEALDRRRRLSLGASTVLVLGIAYRKNVNDTRESPGLAIMQMLLDRGADVRFHDPHVREIPPTRAHPALAGRDSVELTSDAIAEADAVLICTDHDAVDYRLIGEAALVVDTRNAMARRGLRGANVVKA